MALAPSRSDPNRKAQAKRKEEDPRSFGEFPPGETPHHPPAARRKKEGGGNGPDPQPNG